MSRQNMEYLQAGGAKQGTVHIQGEVKVDHLKYLCTVVSADGSLEEEVRRRVQTGWQSWRRASGVLCDMKLSATLKGKMYKSIVRPAMLYGMETVVVKEMVEKRWRQLN